MSPLWRFIIIIQSEALKQRAEASFSNTIDPQGATHGEAPCPYL